MATQTITLTLDATQLQTVVTAYCANYGYSALLADGVTPNPETKAAFTKRMVIQQILDVVKSYQANQAQPGVTIT